MGEEKVLLPHQQRVVEEKELLDDKLSKLRVFINTEIYKNLSNTDKILMNAQVTYMAGYSRILGMRINNF